MKLSKLFAFAAMLIFCTVAGNAQKTEDKSMPFEKFGVGAVVGWGQSALGANVVYAIQPNFHLGVQLGFLFDGGPKDGESTTYLVFAPYGKYFLEPIKMFRPFIQVHFYVSSIPTQTFNQFTGKYETHTETTTSLTISVGSEWFPYQSIGVYGGIKFIQLDIDPSRFMAGIANPFIGIEWFL